MQYTQKTVQLHFDRLIDRDMVGFSDGTSTGLSDRGLAGSVTALRQN